MPDPDPLPSVHTNSDNHSPSPSAMPEPNPRPSQPSLSEAPKKKSRLHWDEQNLISNALEMERSGPRMKIDEPKTPFIASETGSSTSGSAHQSPPESPSFIPGERLVGFQSLENSIPKNGPSLSSDGASSAGSTGRSVHIRDGSVVSGGSSPRSREEFEARRKAHYRNEARVSLELWRNKMLKEDEDLGSDDSGDCNGIQDSNAEHPNGSLVFPKLNGKQSPPPDSEETSGASSLEPNGKVHTDSPPVDREHPE